MNRIDRLTAMILMLQSERVITAERIAAHFELSVRTVYRDIAALGEAGVPIVAEAGIGYSIMRGYHMPPIMFSEAEAVALFMSGELGERFGDDSLKKALRAAMLKVKAVLPAERRDYLGRLSDSISVFGAPEASECSDDGPLMTVQEAVVRRQCLAIDYDTAGRGELKSREVEPMGVIFYGHHWHLIAWCRLRLGMRDFRLDRMKTWKVLGETFPAREDFSLMDFLQSEVTDEELIPVTIVCEKWARERVLSELPAQVANLSEMPDGRVRIEALAYCLDWMARWLPGIGKGAIVLKPVELRQKVRAMVLELAAIYEKPSHDEDS